MTDCTYKRIGGPMCLNPATATVDGRPFCNEHAHYFAMVLGLRESQKQWGDNEILLGDIIDQVGPLIGQELLDRIHAMKQKSKLASSLLLAHSEDAVK